jgi:protein-disulfide isomerase
MSTNGKLLIGVGLVLLLGGGFATAALVRPKSPAAQSRSTEDTTSVQGDMMVAQRTKGDSSAAITIYEFSDFQCPYCRRFWATTMPTIEREYIATGKARLIFINFPIPQLHPNARAAHHFAMCAARQNKFWQVHDLLFRYQQQWEKLGDPSAYFRQLADSAALERGALARCATQHAEEWLVRAETAEASRLGIAGTPAFVINGGLLPGAAPIETWRPILDSIYAAGKTGVAKKG